MNTVQRLEIEHDSFYTDALILLTCSPKDVSAHVVMLGEKYNISKETVYYRIRTKYGKKLSDIRYDYRQPSYETLLQIIKLSNCTEEVQQKLSLTDWEFKGIYDRILGVSTFSKAKILALKSIEIQTYSPSIQDNKSMIYGMRLGDGSYDFKRKAMRIEHSIKQQDWLAAKIKLFKKAYPYVSDTISIAERRFGNTCKWYSKKLQGSAVTHNELDKESMALNINQFGLFILFLDDGNVGTYGYSSVLGFATETAQIGENLIKTLNSYGFNFKQETANYISLKRKSDIQTYINDMILPFSAIIPECMRYKTILKV